MPTAAGRDEPRYFAVRGRPIDNDRRTERTWPLGKLRRVDRSVPVDASHRAGWREITRRTVGSGARLAEAAPIARAFSQGLAAQSGQFLVQNRQATFNAGQGLANVLAGAGRFAGRRRAPQPNSLAETFGPAADALEHGQGFDQRVV